MFSADSSSRQPPLADQYAALWNGNGNGCPDVFTFLRAHPAADPPEQLYVLLVDQKARWQRAAEIPVERYFEQVRSVAEDEQLKRQLIVGEFVSAALRGGHPTVEEYVARFPELDPRLTTELREAGDVLNGERQPAGCNPSNGRPPLPSTTEIPFTPNTEPPPLPSRIGRYLVLRLLGSGGYGHVYLARDDELSRDVAIKVLREDRLASRQAQDFIREARVIAGLNHPGIVTVFDVGTTEDGRAFIVSQYVDGSDLTARVALERVNPLKSAQIVAAIADALQFAHAAAGIIHRDVKPANILIDKTGRAFIADFGIAIRNEDVGRDASVIGTVAYMSPEQIRGEGHLIDCRSDVFSLGVVFYELLTGQRPFGNDLEGRRAIAEPRLPRQIDDQLPRELERICLKALGKRAADRYQSAEDFAEDLRHWLTHAPTRFVDGTAGLAVDEDIEEELETAPLRIKPRGLRYFDAADTDAFLELIPGPRDRYGLPEILRFWKTPIESRDPKVAFRAGLIYGPSGCGKSSLLRAGLLPRLDPSVVVVFIEATAEGTESRLFAKLRAKFRSVSAQGGLTDFLVRIRRGDGPPAGEKLLLVFDQFEQWLHANRAEADSKLVEALRQCDGVRLQCLIGVRDDFWMGISQFMEDLEVEMVPDQNIAPMQLLSAWHARKVLIAFGRSLGRLPQGDLAPRQIQFVDEVIQSLAEHGRVIPVRLALFIEMIKERTWLPETMAEIGGMEGIGAAFLEDAFNSPIAPLERRQHQQAARAVLGSLLTEGEGSIKGDRRTRDQLLALSGYADQPARFATLLRILDTDLRLITPTGPAASQTDDLSAPHQPPTSPYYQLTHDYLVPPLRQWLTRKQKETRRGRAELLLAERAAVWNARPTNRSLPSLLEWLNILLFTRYRLRAGQPQNRKLLRAAGRFHLTRIAAVAVLAAVVLWEAGRQVDRSRARTMVTSLDRARTRDVPAIVAEMKPVRGDANPLLRNLFATTDSGNPAHLHAAMALLPIDPSQEATVYEGLLAATPSDIPALRQTLVEDRDPAAVTEKLWGELLEPKHAAAHRFRAAAALAALDPPSAGESASRWQKQSDFLSKQLIAELTADTTAGDLWIDLMTPIRSQLDADLHAISVNAKPTSVERHLAATVLGRFLADQPRRLTDLLLESEREEYVVLLPKLQRLGTAARDVLIADFDAAIPTNGNADLRREPVRRKAYAAVALLDFDRTEPLRSVLSAVDDPDLGTYAQDRTNAVAARPDLILQMVSDANTPLRAALLRCLAGMRSDLIPGELKEPLVATFERFYQSDPDCGVHSAAEWGLRAWGLNDRLRALAKPLVGVDPVSGREWYITVTGHTMAVFRQPITVQTGSPPDEPDRDSDEKLTTRTINRDFAMSTKEVTFEQFLKYPSRFPHTKKKDQAITPDCPITQLTWHRAAEYCNWLSKQEGIPKDQWCYELKNANATPRERYLTLKGYRLPTEVEWEHACRARTLTAFSWGNDTESSRQHAWTGENGQGRTWPVGSLAPNRFGMFDMHGNVDEWTQNTYHYDDHGVPVLMQGDDTEDSGFLSDSPRSTRGGQSISFVNYCRSANRSPAKARSGSSTRSGFRIARTITSASAPR